MEEICSGDSHLLVDEIIVRSEDFNLMGSINKNITIDF